MKLDESMVGADWAMSFCLDTKGPKSQDLYGIRLGSRPHLRKVLKLATLKQSDFLFASKVCFHPSERQMP